MKKMTIVLLLLALPALSVGADTAMPTPPAPGQLAADWWSYFQPAEAIDQEALEKRAAESKQNLLTFKLKLTPDDLAVYADSIANLLAELQRFVKLKGINESVEQPAMLPADTYIIEQVIPLQSRQAAATGVTHAHRGY